MELETSLGEFYSTKDPERRKVLHAWLLQAKHSPEIWQKMSTLLAFNRPAFVHHFVAGAIEEKVSLHWEQLIEMQGEIDRLREFLPSVLERCQLTPATESKLISALATLVLRSMPDLWPKPLEDLQARWSVTHPGLLFALAAELPSRFKEAPFRVERRSILLTILTNEVSKQVAGWCQQAIDQQTAGGDTDSKWRRLSARCIESWTELSSTSSTVVADWLSVVRSWLASSTSELIQNDCGLLASVIQRLADNDQISHMEGFVREMFHYMSTAIVPTLLQVLATPSAVDDEEQSLLQAVASFCENHASDMLRVVATEEQNEINLCIRPLLGLFLRISSAEGVYALDERASEVPAQFWQTVEEEVGLIDEACRARVRSTVDEYFVELSKTTVVKSAYPKDATVWDKESKESFENYRKQLGDVLASCYRLLDESILERWLQMLRESLTSDRHCPLSLTEAVLFAFQSVADFVTTNSGSVIALLAQDLPLIAAATKQEAITSNTMMRLLDRLAHIVASSENASQMLATTTRLCLPHIGPESTSRAALYALEHLVSERIPEPQQAAVYDSAIACCYGYFSDESHDEVLRLRALRCIGYSLSMKSDSDGGVVVNDGLNRILAPRLERLSSILCGQEGEHKQPVSKDFILFQLSVVSTLTATLDRKQEKQPSAAEAKPALSPVVLVLETSFPLFESLLIASAFDSEVATKICGCLSHGLYAVNDRRLGFVEAYCRIITSMLPANYVAFTVAKPLFLVYAIADETTEDECSQLLGASLDRWSLLFLPLVSNAELIDANADAIEAYLQFVQQVVKKQPRLLSEWGSGRSAMSPLLDTSLGVLSAAAVSQPQLVRHAAAVLSALVARLDALGSSGQLLMQSAEQAIQVCYCRLTTEMVLSTVEYLADVLFNFVRQFPGETRATLKQAIDEHNQVGQMLSEVGNRRRFRTLAKSINADMRRSR